MKMSERISAAANQPTPEQIRAAHRAIAEIAAMSVWGGFPNGLPMEAVRKLLALVDSIRPALPPLPEPERPRITPAGELAKGLHFTAGHFSLCETAIRVRDGEIIAWIGFRIGATVHTPSCHYCAHCALLDLVRELDEADTP